MMNMTVTDSSSLFSLCGGIILSPNHEVVISGIYSGKIRWQQGYSGWTPEITASGPCYNYFPYHNNIFIARLNMQTGAVIAMDSLGTEGGLDASPTCNIVADRNGSFYVGGNFRKKFLVATDTLYATGYKSVIEYDYGNFFVAKYGYSNCDSCHSAPISNYSFHVDSTTHTANFTYSGTMYMDSVKWIFGDNSTSYQINPSHTYTTDGIYYACVTIYNTCGSAMHCDTVNTTTPIPTSVGNVSIYPNPVNKTLHIDNLQSITNYRLLNIIGTTIQQGIFQYDNNIIATEQLPPGMYLLELTNNGGQRTIARIVK
jgi:hypothetical protein